MWRSSKAEIVIVDVLDAWQRFDDANHRQVGQSKQVLPLREMNNLEIDVKKLLGQVTLCKATLCKACKHISSQIEDHIWINDSYPRLVNVLTWMKSGNR